MSDLNNETAISKNLQQVRLQIETAEKHSLRERGSVILVAASKTFSADTLFEAIKAGQYIFGENYVQEAKAKITKLEHLLRCSKEMDPNELKENGGCFEKISFHLLGLLQRNKVKTAIELFDVIQTVERIEVAREIAKEAVRVGKKQKILIQVNISEEATKSGVLPEQTQQLCQTVLSLQGIHLEGLMSIGHYFPEDAPLEQRSREFQEMVSLRGHIASQLGHPLAHLSMGMSYDFELAIREGATMVRVGSAIFGERDKEKDA